MEKLTDGEMSAFTREDEKQLLLSEAANGESFALNDVSLLSPTRVILVSREAVSPQESKKELSQLQHPHLPACLFARMWNGNGTLCIRRAAVKWMRCTTQQCRRRSTITALLRYCRNTDCTTVEQGWIASLQLWVTSSVCAVSFTRR